MATWPVTLPAPLVAGYGIQPNKQTIGSDMEIGAQRVRRITAARVSMLNVQWSMTDAQMAIFRDWFDDPTGAAGGAAWFTISLLMGNGGFETVTARFSGIWKTGYEPHLQWSAQATLEVRDA